MAKPIYMMWRNQETAAFWQLTEEQRNTLRARVREALDKVGVKSIIFLDPFWSTERWSFAGVVEFPDIDALQEYERILQEIGHAQYMVSEVMLATKFEEPS